LAPRQTLNGPLQRFEPEALFC